MTTAVRQAPESPGFNLKLLSEGFEVGNFSFCLLPRVSLNEALDDCWRQDGGGCGFRVAMLGFSRADGGLQ